MIEGVKQMLFRIDEIEDILNDWWIDEKTCSGKPHCSIDECDICVKCFDDIRRRFNIK